MILGEHLSLAFTCKFWSGHRAKPRQPSDTLVLHAPNWVWVRIAANWVPKKVYKHWPITTENSQICRVHRDQLSDLVSNP